MYIKEKIEQYSDMVYRIALTRTDTIENAEIYSKKFLQNSARNYQVSKMLNTKKHGLLELQ